MRFGLQAGVPLKLVAWGLVVWFAVAIFIRLTGPVLLDPNEPLIVAGFFALVIPLMATVTYPIYRLFHVERHARPTAAAMLSIPGMFLDVGLVLAAGYVFPAMTTHMVVNVGAILHFGYGVVLLTGFYPQP
jgi:hypothetical protein